MLMLYQTGGVTHDTILQNSKDEVFAWVGVTASGTLCASMSSLQAILPQNVPELCKVWIAESPATVPADCVGLISQVVLRFRSPERLQTVGFL